ncbi:hypothetical protein CJF30_00006348 [Rutstroemia sp. NJR-2017a BBW]|nr:hypothetical protein CJF30_00006348 [Rutstroemia sp. NJR-2017a BBW]
MLGQEQCRYCELHRLTCTTNQPRKKRFYGNVEGLGGRLILLESLVKGLLPEADLSGVNEMQQLGKALGIPLPQIEDGSSSGPAQSENNSTSSEEEQSLPLLPDQQGQVQYIGDYGSPSETIREIDGHVIDCLVDAYFDIIHSDFPVLHEASFRETYEQWSLNTQAPNPVWLCSLLCVLILALRVSNVTVPEEIERKWWKHIQILLPTVFFTSNILTNLTGTAVRIAFAIGLHRDDVKHGSSPLGRELMKQLWWTLYAFEQMQVSSYDRPSAMESNVSSVGYPNERIVGVAGHCPQDFMKWSQKLVVLLGSACKALNVWDVFYTVASALVLVLDISCRTKEQALLSIPESQDILRNLSNLMSEVLQDPKVPGSMKKWATIVCEVKSVADEFHPARFQSHNPTSTNHLDDPRTSRSEANHEQPDELVEGHSPHTKVSQNAQTTFAEASSSSRETMQSRMREENDEPQHFWAQFMDGGSAAAQDWNWDGIEALLRAGSSL